MVVADELSDLGETLVLLSRPELRLAVLLRIDLHRAELVKHERLAALADTFLLEYGRASVLKLDCNINHDDKWKKHYRRKKHTNQIK